MKKLIAEQRKIKATKTKKPFFNLKRGWFSYVEILEGVK